MTSILMTDTIENYKKINIANYYQNLSKLATIQVSNISLYSGVWDLVIKDKNITSKNE